MPAQLGEKCECVELGLLLTSKQRGVTARLVGLDIWFVLCSSASAVVRSIRQFHLK